MRVFIFLNGGQSPAQFYRKHIDSHMERGDAVICADGGYTLARRCGIQPNLVVGDLDSLQDKDFETGIEVKRYAVNKDFSDFELAIQSAEKMMPERAYVYGALGGRMDHELANILLLTSTSVSVILIEQDVEIYGVHKQLVIQGRKNCLCSLFSLGGPCHVRRVEGFEYALNDEVLKPSSRGLSNIITEDEAGIYLKSGGLVAVVNMVDSADQGF
jgi:thiamine pyrophosphokinase